MLAACGTASFTGDKSRALIALVYRTGLRVFEARALRPKHLDLDGGAIRILHGKSDRFGTDGIVPGAAGRVGQWLTFRVQRRIPACAPRACLHTITRLWPNCSSGARDE